MMRPRYRYHIRWKIALWGMMIVVISMIFSWYINPLIGDALANYINTPERGRFLLWINQGLNTVIFFTFVLLLVIFTSKTMVKRVLDLSTAAKEIARGNFSVRVSEADHHDEIYQLALDFNIMAEQLQRNEYMRKDFISSVSHEIKTPLSIINGYADLLKEDLSPMERKEYVEIISRESRRLLRLSQNMLQISKLDSTCINEQTVFRLDEQLRQVILLLEPRWSAKHLELDVDMDECTCMGNEELLMQVWVNLLDNAIKFTESYGCVSVCLRERGLLKVTVSDNGPGMDQETQDRIYEQFYQGDRSHVKEGAGLGMAIVRRIVDMHQGSISIRSALGEGTSITVCLPLAKK